MDKEEKSWAAKYIGGVFKWVAIIFLSWMSVNALIYWFNLVM